MTRNTRTLSLACAGMVFGLEPSRPDPAIMSADAPPTASRRTR